MVGHQEDVVAERFATHRGFLNGGPTSGGAQAEAESEILAHTSRHYVAPVAVR